MARYNLIPQYLPVSPQFKTSRSLASQSADLPLGPLAIVGVDACVDCCGNLSFCLRDEFLAASYCLFSANLQLLDLTYGRVHFLLLLSSQYISEFPRQILVQIERQSATLYQAPPENSFHWRSYFLQP